MDFFFQTRSTGPKWLLFNFKSMKFMDVNPTDESGSCGCNFTVTNELLRCG